MQRTFSRNYIYYLEHLIDLEIINFPFSPFHYNIELESKESKINIPKSSFTRQAVVNPKWKSTSHKAIKCGVRKTSRMHHLKTAWLSGPSSSCFCVVLNTDLAVLFYKDHLVEMNKKELYDSNGFITNF